MIESDTLHITNEINSRQLHGTAYITEYFCKNTQIEIPTVIMDNISEYLDIIYEPNINKIKKKLTQLMIQRHQIGKMFAIITMGLWIFYILFMLMDTNFSTMIHVFNIIYGIYVMVTCTYFIKISINIIKIIFNEYKHKYRQVTYKVYIYNKISDIRTTKGVKAMNDGCCLLNTVYILYLLIIISIIAGIYYIAINFTSNNINTATTELMNVLSIILPLIYTVWYFVTEFIIHVTSPDLKIIFQALQHRHGVYYQLFNIYNLNTCFDELENPLNNVNELLL